MAVDVRSDALGGVAEHFLHDLDVCSNARLRGTGATHVSLYQSDVANLELDDAWA
jgi:hypothetical protein